jgi:hypothetical protein
MPKGHIAFIVNKYRTAEKQLQDKNCWKGGFKFTRTSEERAMRVKEFMKAYAG